MSGLRQYAQGLFGVLTGAAVAGGLINYNATNAVHAVPAVKTAQEFSSAFRQVSAEVLPSIVSISTTSKARQLEAGEDGLDGQMPLPEMFRNDPRLRELFRNQRRSVPEQHGMGSGFIIHSSGIILTNNHVVSGADEVVVRLHDGREFRGTDIKTDPRTDVAIVRIEGAKDLKAVKLGDSDAAQVGDWVLAIGSPFGLDMSVTAGIISAKGRGMGITDREDFLQTDAAVNPGNSGGPLINLNGEVIGINTAISSRSGGYDGVSFAIPINMANWVSEQLVKSGTVRRAYLGTSIRPVTTQLADKYKVDANQGVLVQQVMEGSPAERAGMEPEDVVIEVNGQSVNSPRSLQSAVERLEIGKKYPVVVVRNGERKTLQIAAEEMPSDFSVARSDRRGGRQNGETVKDFGFQARNLTPDIAKQMGVEAESGVVVTAVAEDSPAEAANLQPGDVIEKVGKTEVKTVQDVRKAVKSEATEEGLVLHVRNADGKRLVILKKEVAAEK